MTPEHNNTTAEAQTPISPIKHIQNAIPIETTESTGRYPDVYEVFTPDTVKQVDHDYANFTFTTENDTKLRVAVLSGDIIRFRYTHERLFGRDFSYAIDPDFEANETEVTYHEEMDAYYIATTKLTCRIEKEGLTVTIVNESGQVLMEDAQTYRAISTLLNGLSEVRITHVAHPAEKYYGLGDKSSELNLRGQKKQNWNTDSFGYSAESDPLYRTIPFYFSLNNCVAYGIFFDTPHRSHFDFDSQDNSEVSFFAEGGEIDYYFINGPELTTVAERYTDLTGKAELPPLWALGFHQCRWSYYPESRVRSLAEEFRLRQIPCDAIYLDIDYMDGYRCFTWNDNHFPDPKSMISDLKADGFQTIVMIDPGLRVDDEYWVYASGVENEVYCQRTNGELMRGPVWPPECVFPDYTRPDVRAWWGKLYKELYVEQGVSGFWNDMNEPAVFKVQRATFPDEVLHDYEGELSNHAKAHNIYGLQMSRATAEGLRQLKPHKRPFLLARATFSGGQRFAALWTGDNIASWEHLHIANRQCQRMSISGFSFVGTDIGGFAGVPTGELMVRWMQMGIFHPFYRIHSMGNNVDGASETNKDDIETAERVNRLDQEPWAFGAEYEAHMKAAIELRYQLLPYLYTTFWQHSTKGTPMIRSLVFYDQQDTETHTREREFLFGDHLLIAPTDQAMTPEGLIVEEKEAIDEELETQLEELDERDDKTEHVLQSTLEAEEQIEDSLPDNPDLIKEQIIYLPRGDWYDFNDYEFYAGQQELIYPVALERIPIFVKAGAILPLYPVQQYVGEIEIETLQLQVYYGEGEYESVIYTDAGEGYAYQEGDSRLATFRMKGETAQLSIQQQLEGTFDAEFKTYELSIIGLPFAQAVCRVDGKEVAVQVDEGKLVVEVMVGFGELVIEEG
ncbi:MAG: TIM-barrel domain-containing protein [Bacteroidota bacterium]